MRLTWYFAAAAAACMAAPVGCAGAGAESRSSSGGTGAGPVDQTSISFSSDKTLDLKPGEAAPITVRVQPGGKRTVGFALLGDAADAALDATVVRTDEDGVAKTVLHAPSVASTFLLRATLIGDGEATDTVQVAVSSKGFATIEAVPHYSGVRHISSWTATAITRTSCAALAATLPDVPPGGLETTGAPKQTLVIHDAPVGPPIAVVIRAGHFAFGCIDAPPLTPNTVTKLGVTVLDKPLDLASARLDFTLEFAPDPTEFGALIADGIEVVEAKVFDQAQDAGFLLTAMGALAPGDFAGARMNYGWDATTAQYLQMYGVNFRSDVEAWTYEGIGIQPPSLALRVTGSEQLTQDLEARLTILTLGSFSPAEAGLTKTISNASWLSQSGDDVHLGATVPWRPSALIASAALVGAGALYPGVPTVGDALALEVDCTELGATLGGYAECDAGCLATLCTEALETAWLQAPSASPITNSSSALSITVAGQAEVDDTAVPTSVDGEWQGSLRDDMTEADVTGAATATKTGSHQPP